MDLNDQQLERYARHIILKEVGGAGQIKLLKARVAVIGAGGLGSPSLMYLAAAGIGTVGVIDDDAVSLSNLQRQILYVTDSVGQAKTEAATRGLGRINPDVEVIQHNVRLTKSNAADLLAEYDIVLDGCDNFTTRLVVSDACVALSKTLVSAAVVGFEGQLATYKPHAGAAYPCYRCLVPDDPGAEEARSCADEGILGAVAGVLGTLQAVEVIKEILGLGDSLAGRLLIYDALGARIRMINLPPDPACKACGARSV